MKIRDVQMNMSAVNKEQYPSNGFPQVAFVGRSNVGKSSLINALLNRKRIARVSQTPGKTRTINFYTINQEFYLVDLPGYGYAKLSKQEKTSWGKIMEDYFIHSRDLVHIFVLVDIRHTPKEDDVNMVRFCHHYDIPVSIIATKADKLSKNEQYKSINEISKTLEIDKSEIFLSSTLKKIGTEEIWSKIEKIFISNQYNVKID